MTKVTGKRQVTIPKAVADRHGIGAGDEVRFEPAGEVIRVVPPGGVRPELDVEERLRLFDQATRRQSERQEGRRAGAEAEALLLQFPVLYPDEAIFRLALRGAASYQFSWFDAHLWAYAEHHGIPEILSEDFQHDRRYGTVRVVDPFRAEAL